MNKHTEHDRFGKHRYDNQWLDLIANGNGEKQACKAAVEELDDEVEAVPATRLVSSWERRVDHGLRSDSTLVQ